MPQYCMVPFCHNTKKNTEGTGVTFHRIPSTKPLIAQTWLRNIRHESLSILSNCYVCSKHFTNDCFTPVKEILPGWKQKRVLKANSVPTLFDYNDEMTNIEGNDIVIKSDDSKKRLAEPTPSLPNCEEPTKVNNVGPVIVGDDTPNHIEQVSTAPVLLRTVPARQSQPRKKTKTDMPKIEARISAASVTEGLRNTSTQTYWFGKSKLSQANLLPYHMLKLIGCQTDVTMPVFIEQETQVDFPANTRIYVDAETQTCTVKNKTNDVMLHIDLQHLEDHNYSKGPQPTYEYSDVGKNKNILITSLKVTR